ncbi:hypothetical protein DVH24_032591 [Malus domestica]|uniref:Uncharacterized protein n=1 Tax=Malus domestica TaxID=3750 RepID=A0A498J7S3_MALDO|nr:hypothetical protein DVH24_032591 [Malus domestica]
MKMGEKREKMFLNGEPRGAHLMIFFVFPWSLSLFSSPTLPCLSLEPHLSPSLQLLFPEQHSATPSAEDITIKTSAGFLSLVQHSTTPSAEDVTIKTSAVFSLVVERTTKSQEPPASTVPFEAISCQTAVSWPAFKKLYSFESYPVSGESDSFRGVFRPNHGELDVFQADFWLSLPLGPATHETQGLWAFPAEPNPFGCEAFGLIEAYDHDVNVFTLAYSSPLGLLYQLMAFVTLGCRPTCVYPGIRGISGSERVMWSILPLYAKVVATWKTALLLHHELKVVALQLF